CTHTCALRPTVFFFRRKVSLASTLASSTSPYPSMTISLVPRVKGDARAVATDSGSIDDGGRTPVAAATDAARPDSPFPSGRSTHRDFGTFSANAHPRAVLPMPREP